jgi:isocitrate/isopropylmalate dehydrogenase
MMLEWLGETDMSDAIDKAVAKVIREKKYRTYDMGGDSTTTEVAQAIADAI